MIRQIFGDKEFFVKLINIALPISVQNLVMTSLNLVDNIMIGQMGETSIASVALANQVYFLMSMFLFGICSGSAVFYAQYWGKKDVASIRRVLGLNLTLSCSVALFFTFVSLLLPKTVLRIFSSDPKVIELGSSFLVIVCISYIFTAVSFSFSFTLRSTGNTKLPMIASIIALGLNTGLGYMLIFGLFFFPEMGVVGAAIAILIARTVEMIIILSSVYLLKLPPAGTIKEFLNIRRDFVGRFFNTTLPVIFNEVLWSMGVTMYSIAYARMGTDIIAAVNISSTVERIATVLFVGISNACAVMVGNKIGEGDEKTAFVYAKRLAILGPVLGIFMGLGVILLSSRILSSYKVSPEVYNNAGIILKIFGLIMAIKIFNMINVVGILRSGGDTKFSLFIDTAGIWFIGVPLAFIGGLVWALPVYIVYILVNLEEAFKFVLGIKRFVSGKWINNLVQHTYR